VSGYGNTSECFPLVVSVKILCRSFPLKWRRLANMVEAPVGVDEQRAQSARRLAGPNSRASPIEWVAPLSEVPLGPRSSTARSGTRDLVIVAQDGHGFPPSGHAAVTVRSSSDISSMGAFFDLVARLGRHPLEYRPPVIHSDT
jgi:hypothetical protein